MIEQSLITVDELKSMPQGHLIVMKTEAFSAQRIMRSPNENLTQAVFKWGIAFENAYSIVEKSERKVQYADNKEVEAAMLERFLPKPMPIDFAKDFDKSMMNLSDKKHSPKTRKSSSTRLNSGNVR